MHGRRLEASDKEVRFSKLDKALPFYPEDAVSILPWAPILDELNDYKIQITGLAQGDYKIKIDGVEVAQRSATDMAAGVDLSAEVLKTGPIAEQVKQVRSAVENKNRLHHDQIFRGIILAGDVPQWVYTAIPREQLEAKKKALIEERLQKVAELDAEVAASLKLKPHQFEIVPASK